jgi:hypothetical protein
VRGIRPQITDRAGKLDSKVGPLAKALDDLEKNLTAVEVQLYQVKLQSTKDPLNFPVKLNNKLAALQTIVESADAKPTVQSVQMFRTLVGRVTDEMNKLDAAIKTQLPQVNGMLQRQKLATIKAEPLNPETEKKITTR